MLDYKMDEFYLQMLDICGFRRVTALNAILCDDDTLKLMKCKLCIFTNCLWIIARLVELEKVKREENLVSSMLE